MIDVFIIIFSVLLQFYINTTASSIVSAYVATSFPDFGKFRTFKVLFPLVHRHGLGCSCLFFVLLDLRLWSS